MIDYASGGRASLQEASWLVHAPVTTGSGTLVAHVEEILINPSTGKLECLVLHSPLEEGGLRVRLDWKDFKFDRDGERLILIPGGTPAKRLIIRASSGGADRNRHPQLH